MSRSIDRALRPLFPDRFIHDISLTASVLSTTSSDIDPDVVAINAASGALMCSDVPWSGPIGACKAAWIHGSLVLNPSTSDLIEAEFVVTLAGTRDRVLMMEAMGKEVPFERIHAILDFAHRECQSMITPQLKLVEGIRPDRQRRRQFTCLGSDPTAALRVASLAEPLFEDIYSSPRTKAERSHKRSHVRAVIEEKLNDLGAIRSDFNRVVHPPILSLYQYLSHQPGSGCVSSMDLDHALMMVEERVLRSEILKKGCRPDGRLPYDIRPLSCQASHIIIMGILWEEKQSHSVQQQSVHSHVQLSHWMMDVQVGNQMDELKIFGPFGEAVKRFMFHYTFPGYAVNEVMKYKGLSRRETGHGALAERALSAVMPDADDFPFPVRIIGETTASNGSSSMAAVCGGSLALIEAGVPIRSLVAGVGIGLVTDYERNYFERKVDGDWKLDDIHPKQSVLLTDIQGIEDRYGDIDFKIAGTMKGVTALQLDVKLPGGIAIHTVKDALIRAQTALATILDMMKTVAASSERAERPAYGKINIDPETLGAVIGEGGKNVRGIESETSARFMISDEGIVDVYAPSEMQLEQAKTMVDDLLGFNIHEGETYDAKVIKVFDYGAYVELPTGFHCLLHISQLTEGRVEAIENLLQIGQMVRVKCIGRDAEGNIHLTSKGLLQ